MSDSIEPPNEKLLARLIAAIGKADAPEAERAWFEEQFRLIRFDVLAGLPRFETDEPYRELLRKFLANSAERQELRARLRPFEYELIRIRILWMDVHGISGKHRDAITMLTDPDFIRQVEGAEETIVRLALETSGDFRKGALRKLAIEPFLVLLRNEDVLGEDMSAPRELPLSRMVDALLSWLGLDPRLHPWPTESGIRTIASECRRDFGRRPSRRPGG